MRLPGPALAAALMGAGSVLPATGSASEPERQPKLTFEALEGWRADDHLAALQTFRTTCRRAHRPALCRAAARARGPAAARRFFERWFVPVEVSPRGFLTGYYEPELAGTLQADKRFRVPLLAKPAGLVAKPANDLPGWPEGFSAALRSPSGYEPLPDRAAIEDGALAGRALPLVFLEDPVDAFFVHVQGSARIRLPDGRVLRVGFDGRNGHPYTAIGRVLAESEGVPPSEMTADRVAAWLRAHPDRAPAVMRANRSYIFFRILPVAPELGPIGAAGVPLSPGRSLAVDPRHWPYGSVFWLDGDLPEPGGGSQPLKRLLVAQDTGAAIVGHARGDLFVGSGHPAGASAALLRNPVRWIALRPRPPRRR